MVPLGDLDGEFSAWKVNKEEVSKWWRLIRPGVERVIDRTNPSFMAEDVYSHLKNDMGWLIITFTEGKQYAGFVIVSRVSPDQFTGRQDLLIWLAYSDTPGAVEATLPEVEAMGKSLGFEYVIFYSSRKGWERRSKSLGFSLRERIYHKKL